MASSCLVALQPPQKKMKRTLPAPTISHDFPEDVVEKIFTFLPFKKVCSLSILSKRFINSWKLCRNLSFDGDFASRLTRDEFRSILNSFFSNRQTPRADRFLLKLNASGQSVRVSSWIHKAIRLGVEELELDLSPTFVGSFILHYGLVDGGSLKILRLVKCHLLLPMQSRGLRLVQEITLQDVSAEPPLIQSIFANCESLRVLRLIKCSKVGTLIVLAKKLKGFHTLEIRNCSYIRAVGIQAPALRSIHYGGKFIDISFKGEMPGLTDVVLDIAKPGPEYKIPNRVDLLDRFANVEQLTLSSIFLEGLCVNYENNECKIMKLSLPHVKEFHLIVAPVDGLLDPMDVVVFVQSFPLIEKLFIDRLGRNAFSSSENWERHGKKYLDASHEIFPFLKFMKVKGFAATDMPVCLVRFFLKHATKLQKLILVKARIRDCFPPGFSQEFIRWGTMSFADIGIYNARGDKRILNF